MAMFGMVALLGAIASVSPLADSNASAERAAIPAMTCSVRGVAGGIELSWNDVSGAESFSYKVDRPGAASTYATASESPIVIPAVSSDRVTVGLVPVVEGGPVQPRTPCGAAAPTEPAISHELRCTLTRDGDGLVAVWNDVEGIASYGVKVIFDNQENAMYRRTTSTQTRVPVDFDEGVSIGVAPVFADGSTLPRVECVDSSA